MTAFAEQTVPATHEEKSTRRIGVASAVMNEFHLWGFPRIAAHINLWTKVALFLHCKKFGPPNFK